MKHTVEELRAKIEKNGWTLKELPIRTGGSESAEIRAWKMIAIRGDRSLTLEGKTLENAITAMSKALGIIG